MQVQDSQEWGTPYSTIKCLGFFDFLIRHLECGGGHLSGALPGELVKSPTSGALFELLDEACCEL